MMKKWLSWLKSIRGEHPKLTPEEATEAALRVFPKCC